MRPVRGGPHTLMQNVRFGQPDPSAKPEIDERPTNLDRAIPDRCAYSKYCLTQPTVTVPGLAKWYYCEEHYQLLMEKWKAAR